MVLSVVIPLTYSDELHQRVVDSHTHRQEEGASWAQLVEHEQLLLLSDLPVIPLLGLLDKLLVLGHQLAIRETDSIDSLQCVVLGVSQEVGRRVFGNSQSLDSASMGYVRTSTEIDQGTTSVDSGRSAIGDLVLDIMLLVAVVLVKTIYKGSA